MSVDKYYIIENNVVVNIALFKEEDAQRLNLRRYPIMCDAGRVEMDWTYLPLHDTFAPPPRDILAEWQAVRRMRDALLQDSDMWVLPDRWATYNQDEQQAWRTYRETLRNIPQTFIDPKEVVWPQKPWVEPMEQIKPSTPEV